MQSDVGPLTWVECSTGDEVVAAVDEGGIDLCILDGEAQPEGGMGLGHQIKDEYPDCPPVLLLVARVADAWLATWSGAEAISPYPVDPLQLPEQVAGLLRRAIVAP